MFFRTKRSGPREYLQIVRNRRDEGKVKQEVVGTIGRTDLIKESGAIDSLLRSGARFSERLALLDAYDSSSTVCPHFCQSTHVFMRVFGQ